MGLPVQEIDRMLLDLEQQYQRDKETLLRMKEFASRQQGTGRLELAAPVIAMGRIAPTRSGKKTDRQIIREFLAGWTGSFTVPDLIAATDRAGNKEAAEIPQDVWTSTLFWLCQNGLAKVVEPRKGNKPGTYQICVSREELISPRRRQHERGFSVQDIVIKALSAYPKETFAKRELIEFVHEQFPEHRERLSSEVLASTIHRLGVKQRGIRIIEQKRDGNVYGKI